MADQNFTFRLPGDVARALEARANTTGQARSAIVIRALRLALGLQLPEKGDRDQAAAGSVVASILDRIDALDGRAASVGDVERLGRQLDELRERVAQLEASPARQVARQPSKAETKDAHEGARRPARQAPAAAVVSSDDGEGWVGSREVFERHNDPESPRWSSYDSFKTSIAKRPHLLAELGYEIDPVRRRRKLPWLRPLGEAQAAPTDQG